MPAAASAVLGVTAARFGALAVSTLCLPMLGARLDCKHFCKACWAPPGKLADCRPFRAAVLLQDLSPKTAANAALFRATASTRRLQRTWRRFATTHKTTAQLARTFVAQGVTYISLDADDSSTNSNSSSAAALSQEQQQTAAAPAPGPVMIGGLSGGSSVRHARFEDFADKLQAPATLRAAQVIAKKAVVHAVGA